MQSIAQGWLLFELTSSPFYLGLFSSLRMVLLLCLFVFAFAASSDLRIVFTCLVMVGALSTVFETLLNTSIQLRVAEAYRGRVMGFYGLTGGGLREFGGMQAGFLAEWTSAPFAIEAGAVILIVVGLFFLGPRLRRLSS